MYLGSFELQTHKIPTRKKIDYSDRFGFWQPTRRIILLVGYNLSPVLWRKLPGSRSAGRVQSVALRIVCERELEIEKFRAQEYWTVDTQMKTPGGDMLTTFPKSTFPRAFFLSALLHAGCTKLTVECPGKNVIGIGR